MKPGDPEFDASFRARWLKQMRALVPDLSDEEFTALIAEFDKIKDQFIKDLEESRRTSKDTTG